MVAVAVIPAIATYALVHLRLDAGLGDLVPEYPNDQTGYWHYILSFSAHGLDTGYYSPDEQLAQLGVFRYDISGPFYPAVYGSVAWIFGWDPSTSTFFNMAFVGLALALFVGAAPLDGRQTALVAALAVLFGPLLLYIPTAMQESFQQAVAIVLALLFTKLISREEAPSDGFRLGGIALISAVSLTRFSWALLLIPFVLLAYRPRSRARLFGAVGATVGLIAAILALFAASTPPGGNSVLMTLGSLPEEPGETLSTVLSTSQANLEQLMNPTAIDSALIPATVDAVAVQSWLVVALALAALVAGTGAQARVARRRQGGGRPAGDDASRREWLFHAYNLGSIVAASIVLYLPTGYYRVLGAHLLLSLLVMVGSRRFAPVAIALAIGAATFPSVLNLYDSWTQNFKRDTAQLEIDREQVARHIRYRDDAPSPWCNTVLLPVPDYDARVTLIPAGIGVSYLLNDTFETIDQPLRSRYVLLDERDASIGPPEAIVPELRQVARFSFGRLYLNPASPCDGG